MKPRLLTPFIVVASTCNRHALRSIASACVVTLTLGAHNASAATWASSQSGNWDNIAATGWNGAYPNAVGAVAAYDNTAATANAQITQNVVAGVTVSTISLSGTGAASARSLTIVPTNAIVFDEDGIGEGAASIVHDTTTGANVNDRLIFNAGTLTLADDLLISKSSTVSIVANAIQISSTIGGTGNVTLQSSSNATTNGNIFLSPSAANTFTGNVLIRKGAITFNHKDAFGNAANTITLGESAMGDAILITTASVGIVPQPIVAAAGAGALTLGSNSTATTAKTTFSGTVTANGPLSLTSASPGTQPVTFSNTISGAGGILKVGVGTVALNAANNYTGGTTISAGILAVGSSGTLGDNVVGNDITISGGNLLLSSPANLGGNQAIIYNSGGIGVNFTPASPIPLTDNSTAGGVFGINYTGTGGVTSLGSLYNGYWFLGSFTVGIFDGATLGSGGDSIYRLGGGGGTLTIANSVLVGANDLLIGGIGGGRVILPAANTFTGPTTIESATVGISSIGDVGAGSSSLGNPASEESAILLGSGANAVGIDYTGSTAASSNRVLNLAGTTGKVTLSNSGTAPINWTSPLVFSGIGARTIQLGNTTDSAGGAVNGITDQGLNKTSLVKAGISNSTWTLTGNTYTGNTQIDGGVLDASLASLSGSYINLDGDSDTQYGVIQSSGSLTRTLSTTAAAANIKLGTNSGFAARGGDLTVTLSAGAPLNWGGTAFMGTGTARLVFGSTSANGKVTFTNDINLNTNDAFERRIYVEQGIGGDSAELTGVISPGTLAGGGPAPSGIQKLGNGTLILSGINTYKGVSTVNAGKLLINGDQTAATGTSTVNTGGTLGGTGTVGGAVIVNSGGTLNGTVTVNGAVTVSGGGTLAPGTSVGTLNVLAAVTFAGTPGSSALAIEINGANADRLNVTGNLNIAVAALNVSQISAPTEQVYVIATYGSLTGADFSSKSGVPSGYDVIVGYNSQNQIALVKTVTQTPFEQWATGAPYNLSGNDALPGADPDNDGTKNLLEFVLGGNPTTNDSPPVLPTMSTSVDDLVIVFKRSDISELAPAVTVKVQTSDDLTFSTPANDITISATDGTGPNGATYTVTDEAGSLDTITVTIPKALAARKFARVIAVQP